MTRVLGSIVVGFGSGTTHLCQQRESSTTVHQQEAIDADLAIFLRHLSFVRHLISRKTATTAHKAASP